MSDLLAPAEGFTLVYDGSCAFCVACRNWVERRPARVPIRFLDSGEHAAKQWLRSVPSFGDEVILVADDGRTWIGDDAIRVTLWALRDWRWASMNGIAGSIARQIVRVASRHRRELSPLLGAQPHGGRCDTCGPAA